MHCGNCGKQIDDASTFCMHCGMKLEEGIQNDEYVKIINNYENVQDYYRQKQKYRQKQETAYKIRGESYFDGNTGQLIGYWIIFVILFAITLGIACPWLVCMMQNWETKHTVIQGRRLRFDGKGHQLIGKYLLWVFLTIITFGIYGIWLGLGMKKWIVKHTFYEDDARPVESYFSGGAAGYFGIHVLSLLLTLCTLGLGKAWADKMILKWEAEHTYIGGEPLAFNGTGGQLFVKYLLLGLFTPLTLGFYALCFPVGYRRWRVKHTEAGYQTSGMRAQADNADKDAEQNNVFPVIVGVAVMLILCVVGYDVYRGNSRLLGRISPARIEAPTPVNYGRLLGLYMRPAMERPDDEWVTKWNEQQSMYSEQADAGAEEEAAPSQGENTMETNIAESIIGSWVKHEYDTDIPDAGLKYRASHDKRTFTFRSDGTYYWDWVGYLCTGEEGWENSGDPCFLSGGNEYWMVGCGDYESGAYTLEENRLELTAYDLSYEKVGQPYPSVCFVEVNGDTLTIYDEWGGNAIVYTRTTEEYFTNDPFDRIEAAPSQAEGTMEADTAGSIIGNWVAYEMYFHPEGDSLWRCTFTFRSDGTYSSNGGGFESTEGWEGINLDECLFYDGRYWMGATGSNWENGRYTLDQNRLELTVYDAEHEEIEQPRTSVRYVEVSGDTLKFYDESAMVITGVFTRTTEEY